MKIQFDQVIGTGGIGSGILFESNSNRSLNRTESRMAELGAAKDYCKQHIILHYIAKVFSNELSVYAIGMVGNDAQGVKLIEEMQSAGISTQMVTSTVSHPTMFSVCLQYPDKCVCNITTANSACNYVTPQYILRLLKESQLQISERTLVLAVPEVPVDARLTLLREGASHFAFCVASLLCDEVQAFKDGGGFEFCDLLSVNEEEARAIALVSSDDTEEIVERCGAYLSTINPEIMLIVTCGKKGSYSFHRGNIEHISAPKANIISTAGAGDAYIAGVICGLSMGFPFQRPAGVHGKSIRATDLGTFFAGKAVESEHTISEEINRKMVQEFVEKEMMLTDGV